MRAFFICCLLAGGFSVNGCRAAVATEVDANNPAQCEAAFYWGKYQLLKQPPPRRQGVWHMAIGAVYNASKAKSAGVSDLGKAESTAFLAKHANDRKTMIPLLEKCVNIELADPFLIAHTDEFAALALKVDPDCKKDATVCTN